MRSAIGLIFLAVCAAPLVAQSIHPKFEAGGQVGALDERDAGQEKPAIAGGRAGLRLWRFVDGEAEINRLPVGVGTANFPATEFLFGAKACYRTEPFGLFATIRPGFLRFEDSNLSGPRLGTRPEINFGAALEAYARH